MKHIAPHQWADLQAGRLSAGQRARALAHAATCERCAAARQAVVSAMGAFADIANQPAPNLGWDEIRAQVHWRDSSARHHAVVVPTRTRWWTPGLVGGFALAAVAVAAVVGWRAATTPDAPSAGGPGPQLASAVDAAAAKPLRGSLEVAVGEVALDGARGEAAFERGFASGGELVVGTGRALVQFGVDSAFALGADSRVRATHFDEAVVKLALEGTIDIEVGRRTEGQVFVVQAGDAEIEVRGTQFRVAWRAGHLAVACAHGAVEVRRDQQRLVLEAGQHATFAEAGVGVALPLDAAARAQLIAAAPARSPEWIGTAGGRASSLVTVRGAAAAQPLRLDGVDHGRGPLLARLAPGRHALEWHDGERWSAPMWIEADAQPRRIEVAMLPGSASASSSEPGRSQRASEVRALAPSLASCARTAHKLGLGSSQVRVRLTIARSGAVTAVSTTDPNGEQAGDDVDGLANTVQACVRDRLRAHSFVAGPAATVSVDLTL